MIFDRLDAADRYSSLHPGFAQAVAALRRMLAETPAPGRHEIDGERLFILVSRDPGRGHHGARLEAHRRYIDLQLCLSGHEVIGWRPLAECRQPTADHDPQRDIRFFADPPETWLEMPPGALAVFFPTDAHAPLAGEGEVLKAVVKVEV